MGIAYMGTSFGGVVFSLLLNPIFEHFEWREAMWIVTGIVAIFVGVGNLCVEGRLPGRESAGRVNLSCFKDMRFVWITIGVCCEFSSEKGEEGSETKLTEK